MRRSATYPEVRDGTGRGRSRTGIEATLFAQTLTLLIMLLPAGARAQVADTIRACYVPASGTIYRIAATNAPAGCLAASHVEFSWTTATAAGLKAAGGKGGGGSTVDHGGLGGLTDDDHPQYLLTDGVRQSLDGFAIEGTLGQGTLPVTGAGVRMLWYPGKAAFRAGYAYSTYWDDANIGNYSSAMGRQVAAVGDYSTALGYRANAWGMGAFAASGGTASGQYARAMGAGAEASGGEATAIGYLTKATGGTATAIGNSAQATGDQSVALGSAAQATALQAVSLGFAAFATDWGAAAVGYTAKARGRFAVALGETEASGERSVSMGSSASTNGMKGAFVYGDASTSTDLNATADNQFAVRAQRIWLGTTSTPTATPNRYIETSTGAYLSAGGAWVSSSDSTKKHLWQDVDGEDLLTKLAAMPIRTWSYRTEEDAVRHIGPTAQEFRSAFGLGDTDRAIASVDADGVALVAAQALERRTRVLEQRLATFEALAAEIEALRSELRQLREDRDTSPRPDPEPLAPRSSR